MDRIRETHREVLTSGGLSATQQTCKQDAEYQRRQKRGKPAAQSRELGDETDHRRTDQETEKRNETQDRDILSRRAVTEIGRSRDGERKTDGNAKADTGETEIDKRRGRRNDDEQQTAKRENKADARKSH